MGQVLDERLSQVLIAGGLVGGAWNLWDVEIMKLDYHCISTRNMGIMVSGDTPRGLYNYVGMRLQGL